MGVPIIRFLFDRRHVASENKKGSVELVITHNKQRKYLSTGVKCYPHQWKDDAKRNIYVKGTVVDMELNSMLHTIYQKVFKAISEMVDKGEIDLAAIPDIINSKSVDMTFIEYVFDRIEKKNNNEYTHKAHVTFFNKLSQYGKIKHFSDINEKSIRDLDEWLHSYKWKETDRFGNVVERKYTQATIGSVHKNLKAFINDAIVDGYVKDNPYSAKRIKIDKGGTRIDKFLTQDEIDRLEAANMPTRPLKEAKDLFLMQIFTGLSYADLMVYDFTKCKEAQDYAIFSGFRQKTGVLFTFVLTPKAKSVLEQYNYKLPKLPNQKYNTRLKMVADAAGIDKNISSHDGRRSCGFMLLNAGIPISVVSRVLGHSSIRQTEKAYARVLDETIAKEFKKHIK